MEGRTFDGAETEAMSRDGDPRVEMASAEPRIFGAVPPALALVVGLAGLVLGIVALGSGALVAGIVLLVAGACLTALALDASRRWPNSAIPRISAAVAHGVGARMGFLRASAGAWSGASREVVRMRREVRGLRHDREAHLLALGEVAYREDAKGMQALREELSEIDAGIEERETRIAEELGRAKERVKRERAAVPQTQSFAVVEVEPSPGEDGATRPIPTAERTSR